MEGLFYSTQIRYSVFEYKSSNHTIKCIDGRITGSNKCIGYCQCDDHPGFLTKDLRKKHNCLGKGCFYYIGKPKSTVK